RRQRQTHLRGREGQGCLNASPPCARSRTQHSEAAHASSVRMGKMDEHNIEELKRQLKLTTDRQQQAAQDVRDSKQRLQDARNAASGVMGHVLEYTKIRGWGSKEKVVTRRLIV